MDIFWFEKEDKNHRTYFQGSWRRFFPCCKGSNEALEVNQIYIYIFNIEGSGLTTFGHDDFADRYPKPGHVLVPCPSANCFQSKVCLNGTFVLKDCGYFSMIAAGIWGIYRVSGICAICGATSERGTIFSVVHSCFFHGLKSRACAPEIGAFTSPRWGGARLPRPF